MDQRAYGGDSEFPPLEAGKLRIYGNRFCPFTERVRLVLAAKGVEYEQVNIRLRDKPKWYLEKFPAGRTPGLEQDDRLLWESMVVCEYLDQMFTQNVLFPKDPYDRARIKLLVSAFDPVVPLGAYPAYCKSTATDKEAEAALLMGLEPLEAELTQLSTPFFGGNKPRILDFLVWPWFERFPAFHELSGFQLSEQRFPNLNRWMERMYGQMAVQVCMHATPLHVQAVQLYKDNKSFHDVGLD
ncbi:glutathione S-transferase omega-2-like [Branchiostoma floridae]|uniref:Glutathione-dependent dehydroascorbate reductase n=1 Tax=Branchiostoma floridae TaxID=7739 RepID=A0A9J7KWG4_BRAFL|nr:glutathione S-transferase omega-2-like [Branchiostoma floridae]XP_035671829.1 glutathione S-transferase omega-2-like [Branchiostoma floridae]